MDFGRVSRPGRHINPGSLASVQPFFEELSVAAQGRLIRFAGLLISHIPSYARHELIRRRIREMRRVLKAGKVESLLFDASGQNGENPGNMGREE